MPRAKAAPAESTAPAAPVADTVEATPVVSPQDAPPQETPAESTAPDAAPDTQADGDPGAVEPSVDVLREGFIEADPEPPILNRAYTVEELLARHPEAFPALGAVSDEGHLVPVEPNVLVGEAPEGPAEPRVTVRYGDFTGGFGLASGRTIRFENGTAFVSSVEAAELFGLGCVEE